jgi:hypothetical protein
MGRDEVSLQPIAIALSICRCSQVCVGCGRWYECVGMLSSRAMSSSRLALTKSRWFHLNEQQPESGSTPYKAC